MKKLFSLSIAITTMIFSSSTTFAKCNNKMIQDPQHQESIPYIVSNISYEENMGSLLEIHDLYNSDNDVVAFCADYSIGYIIYDVFGNLVEYSPTTPSPYLDVKSKAYYGGPMTYAEVQNNTYIDIKTKEKVSINELDFVSIQDDTIQYAKTTNNITSTDSDQFKFTLDKVTHPTRKLNYNVNGLNACGSLAAAIVFCYYYDYIDKDYLTTFYGNTANSINLFEKIRTITEPNKTGTNFDTLPEGIMKSYKYISSLPSLTVKIQTTGDYWGRTKYNCITQNTPVIADVSRHSKYGEHWVVAYGTQTVYMGATIIDKLFVVNDGWGSTDIRINLSYCDGIVYF